MDSNNLMNMIGNGNNTNNANINSNSNNNMSNSNLISANDSLEFLSQGVLPNSQFNFYYDHLPKDAPNVEHQPQYIQLQQQQPLALQLSQPQQALQLNGDHRQQQQQQQQQQYIFDQSLQVPPPENKILSFPSPQQPGQHFNPLSQQGQLNFIPYQPQRANSQAKVPLNQSHESPSTFHTHITPPPHNPDPSPNGNVNAQYGSQFFPNNGSPHPGEVPLGNMHIGNIGGPANEPFVNYYNNVLNGIPFANGPNQDLRQQLFQDNLQYSNMMRNPNMTQNGNSNNNADNGENLSFDNNQVLANSPLLFASPPPNFMPQFILPNNPSDQFINSFITQHSSDTPQSLRDHSQQANNNVTKRSSDGESVSSQPKKHKSEMVIDLSEEPDTTFTPSTTTAATNATNNNENGFQNDAANQINHTLLQTYNLAALASASAPLPESVAVQLRADIERYNELVKQRKIGQVPAYLSQPSTPVPASVLKKEQVMKAKATIPTGAFAPKNFKKSNKAKPENSKSPSFNLSASPPSSSSSNSPVTSNKVNKGSLNSFSLDNPDLKSDEYFQKQLELLLERLNKLSTGSTELKLFIISNIKEFNRPENQEKLMNRLTLIITSFEKETWGKDPDWRFISLEHIQDLALFLHASKKIINFKTKFAKRSKLFNRISNWLRFDITHQNYTKLAISLRFLKHVGLSYNLLENYKLVAPLKKLQVIKGQQAVSSLAEEILAAAPKPSGTTEKALLSSNAGSGASAPKIPSGSVVSHPKSLVGSGSNLSKYLPGSSGNTSQTTAASVSRKSFLSEKGLGDSKSDPDGKARQSLPTAQAGSAVSQPKSATKTSSLFNKQASSKIGKPDTKPPIRKPLIGSLTTLQLNSANNSKKPTHSHSSSTFGQSESVKSSTSFARFLPKRSPSLTVSERAEQSLPDPKIAEVDEPAPVGKDGIKSILRRKNDKATIKRKRRDVVVKWKDNDILTSVKYFEFDPEERKVDVHLGIKEHMTIDKHSKGGVEDKEGAQKPVLEQIEKPSGTLGVTPIPESASKEENEEISWYTPVTIDFKQIDWYEYNEDNSETRGNGTVNVESAEKDIQAVREKVAAEAVYGADADLPASPDEPLNGGSGGVKPDSTNGLVLQAKNMVPFGMAAMGI